MLQDNIYGRCARTVNANGQNIYVDLDLFFVRLLLFEKYTLESLRLKELPFLASTISIDGLLELLESGSLKFHWEPISVADIAQLKSANRIAIHDGLPSYTYSISAVELVDLEHAVDKCLKVLKTIPNITHRQLKRLKRAVSNNIVYHRPDAMKGILESFWVDLKNEDFVKSSIINEAGKAQPSDNFFINIEKVNNNDIIVRTNICSWLGIDINAGFKVVQSAILRIGGLNERLSQMKDFDSVIGFHSEKDFELYDRKFHPISREISEQKAVKELGRLINLKELPDVNSLFQRGSLDIKKLLKVRESHECRDFRRWLWAQANLSDEEILERFSGIKGKLGNKLTSLPSRVIRFVVGGAVGMFGLAPGAAVTAVDQFVLDQVFKKDGVRAFVDNLYPSLWRTDGS